MNNDQRVAMARSLLPILRSTVDSAASSGSELAPAFAGAITAECNSPTLASYNGQYVITAAAALELLTP
jgi:hypothetical protein